MATPAVWQFYLRRLHSLAGIFPIGVFLLEHFFGNAFATRGPEAYNRYVEFLLGMPYLPAMEIGLVFGPLLFHGIYGLFITAGGDAFHPAQGLGPRYHNVAYVLQRITGIILLLYIIYHVWNTRVQAVFFGQHVDYAYMARYLAPAYEKAIYIVGIVCACYHFAHGLFNVAYKWGLTVSAKAQQAMTYASLVVFAAMSAVGIHILFSFK
ncbi:MAG: succinate dehydrogenase [candidate division NC10 bacterium]|nr:succinate dehydrogenase [candidate division NC10 bacterium]